MTAVLEDLSVEAQVAVPAGADPALLPEPVPAAEAPADTHGDEWFQAGVDQWLRFREALTHGDSTTMDAIMADVAATGDMFWHRQLQRERRRGNAAIPFMSGILAGSGAVLTDDGSYETIGDPLKIHLAMLDAGVALERNRITGETFVSPKLDRYARHSALPILYNPATRAYQPLGGEAATSEPALLPNGIHVITLIDRYATAPLHSGARLRTALDRIMRVGRAIGRNAWPDREDAQAWAEALGAPVEMHETPAGSADSVDEAAVAASGVSAAAETRRWRDTALNLLKEGLMRARLVKRPDEPKPPTPELPKIMPKVLGCFIIEVVDDPGR